MNLSEIQDTLRGAIREIQDAILDLNDISITPVPASPDPTGPVVITIPGAPPEERRVQLPDGRIFVREPARSPFYGQWGAWRCLVTVPGAETPVDSRVTWGNLLMNGPITLLELTDEERALADLYGPPGARWGHIGTPCPYTAGGMCSLWFGHVGLHVDPDGNQLGMTSADPAPGLLDVKDQMGYSDSASVTRDDLDTYCTCGHPAVHAPTCPRYLRMTGGRS